MVDTDEVARRLAWEIVSDIDVYNPNKSGADLIADLDKGRALFNSSVVPGLVPLFEEMLADQGLAEGWHSMATKPALSMPPSGFEEESAVPVAVSEEEKIAPMVGPNAAPPAQPLWTVSTETAPASAITASTAKAAWTATAPAAAAPTTAAVIATASPMLPEQPTLPPEVPAITDAPHPRFR